jgi:hypothetical protein
MKVPAQLPTAGEVPPTTAVATHNCSCTSEQSERVRCEGSCELRVEYTYRHTPTAAHITQHVRSHGTAQHSRVSQRTTQQPAPEQIAPSPLSAKASDEPAIDVLSHTRATTALHTVSIAARAAGRHPLTRATAAIGSIGAAGHALLSGRTPPTAVAHARAAIGEGRARRAGSGGARPHPCAGQARAGAGRTRRIAGHTQLLACSVGVRVGWEAGRR